MYYLLSFLLWLKDRLKASGSILNYFSSVKSWVAPASGRANVFEAPEIATMKRGIIKNSLHVLSVAPPISPKIFKSIICYMHRLCPRPPVIITALLFSYFTLARQSNIVVSALAPTYSPHVLLWSDVPATDNEVLVSTRSTKMRGSSVPPVIFSLPYIPGSPCCPGNFIHKQLHIWLQIAQRLYSLMVPG